jgi:hypothetical protein
MVQLSLLFSVVEQVEVETANGPVVEYEMLVRVVGKLFFNVTFLAVLLVPTLVSENVRLAGVRGACATPVPESATVCGLPEALSVKLSVPAAAPSSVGVNVTLTVHVLPAASVDSHVLVEIAKLSLAAILPMSSVVVPVFFTVTVLAALVVSTAWSPKLSEVGENTTVVPELVVIVSVSVVVAVRLPDVPVMVTVALPVVAVVLAVSTSVLVLVAGFGLKVAVTPLGKPEAESVTLPLNPSSGVIVIALFPSAPCATLKLLGLAESVKLGEEDTKTYAAPCEVVPTVCPVAPTVMVLSSTATDQPK